MSIKGQGAQPVFVTTERPRGGPVQRVAVVSTGPFIGGPALPVRVITDADLAGGGYSLSGDVVPLPVYATTGGQVVSTSPIPVYVVSGSLSGAAAQTYTQKVQTTAAANLIAYFAQAESSGVTIVDESGNSRNGSYHNAASVLIGVTLGATGIGDGRTGATYDGTTGYGNIYTAGLAGAWSGDEGTFSGWVKMAAAGTWTDATFREFIRILVDGSNLILIDKSSTVNGVRFNRTAGGTAKIVTDTSLGGPTGWFHVGLTWSKSGDAQKCYLAGAQVGATQTGLGSFSGALVNNTTCLGSSSSLVAATVHSGSLAHWAIWNTPLTAAQIAALAVVP